MQPEVLHPVSIDIEDEPLPAGYKQTLRITVWMANPNAPDAVSHRAPALAAAFLERALHELRSQAVSTGEREQPAPIELAPVAA